MVRILAFAWTIRIALLCGLPLASSAMGAVEIASGMSEAEVVEALGEPSSRLNSGSTKFLVYQDGTRVELSHGFVTRTEVVNTNVNTYSASGPVEMELEATDHATAGEAQRPMSPKQFLTITIITAIQFALMVWNIRLLLRIFDTYIGIGRGVAILALFFVVSIFVGVSFLVFGISVKVMVATFLGGFAAMVAIANLVSGLGNWLFALLVVNLWVLASAFINFGFVKLLFLIDSDLAAMMNHSY